MARTPRSDDLESTLLWITTGYRVFAAAWLSILGVVDLASASTEVDHPSVVVATVVVVVVWASLTTVARVLRPGLARSWVFVALDLGLGAWTAVAGIVAGTIQFAGGYPLAGAFAAIYAFGTTGGIIGAAILTAAGLIPVIARRESFSQEVANGIAYIFSVGAATAVAAVLRWSDRRRVQAETALAEERAERVRAEEHAEVAAHLHDSVLQTLALIQRDPTSTPEIKGLARHQEHELRSWLFPDNSDTALPDGGFREALVQMCSEVEDRGPAKVELVVVGNTPASIDPIVRAAREAIVNAQAHAGVELISVYGEAGDRRVQVFVKDRGCGFDPDAIDSSRHGVRESIVGRMERHGGSAEIISGPGEGTEVRLHLPLDKP
jgi:signal transduction histidine kinase